MNDIKELLMMRGYDCFNNNSKLFVLKEGFSMEFELSVLEARMTDDIIPLKPNDIAGIIESTHQTKLDIQNGVYD